MRLLNLIATVCLSSFTAASRTPDASSQLRTKSLNGTHAKPITPKVFIIDMVSKRPQFEYPAINPEFSFQMKEMHGMGSKNLIFWLGISLCLE